MPQYLLSSQSVLEIVKRIGLPEERWLQHRLSNDGRPLDEDDVWISAVVSMTVIYAIETEIGIAQRERSSKLSEIEKLKKNADHYLNTFLRSDRIVPMDKWVADQWGRLLDIEIPYVDPEGNEYNIESSEKVELATAIIGRNQMGFVYVDRNQEIHSDIDGLAVECPHEFVAGHDSR